MFISMHSQVPKRILGLGGDLVSHAQTHEEGLFPRSNNSGPSVPLSLLPKEEGADFSDW